MKFYLKHIILWLKNGNQRILNFENNKVNIITGKQSTGKSTIIDIIDYCFFASKKNMPEGEIIDDNVEWYGINFIINDSDITIGRHQNIKLNKYYFSSDGIIPKTPIANFKEENLKNIINKEFSIDVNVVFPYGGKEITKDSKISPRYFMLFNTQRRDTLSHEDTLFDKQSGSKNIRYIEALERIFDISLGVSTIENLIKIEKLKEKERELIKLENQQEIYLKKEGEFDDEISIISDRAKQLKLININDNNKDSILNLKKQIESLNMEYVDNENILYKYEKEQFSLQLKISKFQKYDKQYKEYKNLIKKDYDSLKPIEYLKENFTTLLDDEILDYVIINLNQELQIIKQFINSKSNPASIEFNKILKQYKKELKEIKKKISNFDESTKLESLTQKEQIIFLGEIKAKLELYTKSKLKINYINKIKDITKEISDLDQDIIKIDRSEIITMLNDLMFEVFNKQDFKLGGYEEYRPFFDIKTKLVFLKKIDKIVKKIGSSSNHLFLHLAFFTAIHRLFSKKKIPFISPFLILDQPDSPYYSTDNKEKNTFYKALGILDDQITYFKDELNEDFQIIVLEHEEWKNLNKANFKNYNLVEEWREEGSGLIPRNLL